MPKSTTPAISFTDGDWPEVTKEILCPICAKDHRCKVAPDGNAVRCFRTSNAPAGWTATRRHPDGGATFHREGRAKARQKQPRPSQTTRSRRLPKLSDERLNDAYSFLIGLLVLNALP